MNGFSPYLCALISTFCLIATFGIPAIGQDEKINASFFLEVITDASEIRKSKLEKLDQEWQDTYLAPLIEVLLFARDEPSRGDIRKLLSAKTGQEGRSSYDWLPHLWASPATYDALYIEVKSTLYSFVDPRFRLFFEDRLKEATIRWDEVVWGGVSLDGIPPLRYPEMIPSGQALYLDEGDIVFGFYINGTAHAYPKRILAWHEFFVNNIGGVEIAGVYCTLCGTVIGYRTEQRGTRHQLGTSGFLYRSNKLMYDAATQSLWNTIEGRPVIGPLIHDSIELQTTPVVTTTWGEWSKAHPTTLVLSPQTGHQRDYSEGAAYRDYFATDNLMFPVPLSDNRLAKKDEVVVIRTEDFTIDPLAISMEYLQRKGMHQDIVSQEAIIALASKNGAARIYYREDVVFRKFRNGKLTDSEGQVWEVTEETLQLGDRTLKRVPSHSVFWFAWFNQFPHTRLVR